MAAVEFALVVPLLLLLVFGIIEFGYALNRYTMLNNAAREGVREASLGSTRAEVVDTVEDSLDGARMTPAVVEVTCLTPEDLACGSYDASATSGGTALVTVSYEHEWLTPLGSTFSDVLDLTKSSRMRIE